MTIDIKAIRARLEDENARPWAHTSAAFNAAARFDIPALLEEVERLRALLAGATEIIATIHASADDESVGSVKVNMSRGRNYLPYTAQRWLADAAKGTP